MTSPLFTPLTLRGLTMKNRLGVPPMCTYGATDGRAGDWHFAHYGALAQGGAGLIIMEATGVTPQGRISPRCLGLWTDEQIAPLSRITAFATSQGSAIGIQLAHAGRKASTAAPQTGADSAPSKNIAGQLSEKDGGWTTVAPSALPFLPGDTPPVELSLSAIGQVRADFVSAAKRAVAAGFQLLEIHAAHGYLLHEFLSPLSNRRKDIYGQDRRRLLLEIAEEIRRAVPDHIVLAARLSCTDWVDGGITVEDSVETARQLKKRGVDLIDCSSGGLIFDAKVAPAPGFQVPFAKAVKDGAGIPVCAVGLITTPQQAEEVVRNGDADIVLIGREMLRDPHFPLHAAHALGAPEFIPPQYARAFA